MANSARAEMGGFFWVLSNLPIGSCEILSSIYLNHQIVNTTIRQWVHLNALCFFSSKHRIASLRSHASAGFSKLVRPKNGAKVSSLFIGRKPS
jgi:hypothetical protein